MTNFNLKWPKLIKRLKRPFSILTDCFYRKLTKNGRERPKLSPKDDQIWQKITENSPFIGFHWFNNSTIWIPYVHVSVFPEINENVRMLKIIIISALGACGLIIWFWVLSTGAREVIIRVKMEFYEISWNFFIILRSEKKSTKAYFYILVTWDVISFLRLMGAVASMFSISNLGKFWWKIGISSKKTMKINETMKSRK